VSAVAILPAATFDESDLLDRLDGDVELLVDLAQTFVDQHGAQLAGLRASLDQGDLVTLGKRAHGLKGGLLTLSATSSKVAITLEGAAKEGRVEICKDAVRTLEQELPRLAMDLQAAIERFKA
jgi:HPt (histidine-containing phosphotransfer) domain-containing protein